MERLLSKKFYFLLFGFFLTGYLLIQPGHIYTSDTVARYEVTKSIVEDGKFSIPRERCQDLVVPGVDGQYYAFAGIGQSILFIPLYWAGKFFAYMFPALEKEYIVEFCVSLLNALITAIGCVVLFAFGINIGYSRKVSFWLSLIYGVTTMAVIYARDSFEQPQESLFLLYALLSVYIFVKKQNIRWLIGSAILSGVAILTRMPAIAVVPIILIYIAVCCLRKDKPKALLYKNIFIYLGALLPFLLFIAWYNYVRFHSIFETGYAKQWQNSNVFPFSNPFFYGLYGLLFSPIKGLLFYTPVIILAVIFWKLFHRKDRNLSLLFAGIIIFYILFYAKSIFWDGGWCWGTRLLLPILPLVILPLGAFLESNYFKKKFMKILFISFVAIGFVEQLPAIPVNYAKYRYVIDTSNSHQKYNPVILQWEMVFDVINTMIKSDPHILSVKSEGFSRDEMSTQARTMNIIDIWYVHFYYMNFSKVLTGIIVWGLVFLFGVSGYLLRKQLYRE
ncbi:MAG: glycosyltransferase family 39 protein [bacterium]|nr:glycosyltransferase family 39 protein [bacterium]